MSLIAAGGWCAPSNTIWDLMTAPRDIYWDDVDMTRVARIFETGVYEPVPEPEHAWLSLPTIRAARGGIVHNPRNTP